ncbi:sensor histidine kinase [Sphingomonas sp.]|uniref:sensor histidine kinase n=1 Tax=Sphingomonas sp. TaxID=28214 RepID=UPI001B11AB7A|nr:sensor histidine kinase [Sphingomonas sp.]MBO9712171.1 sensor histidine kinase [Sphingomonas sp.]
MKSAMAAEAGSLQTDDPQGDLTSPFIGLSSADALSDEQILRIILKVIANYTHACAYHAEFIPQVGPQQGERVPLTAGFAALPHAVKEHILEKVDGFDFGSRHKLNPHSASFDNLIVVSSEISSTYDINLGIVFFVTEQTNSHRLIRYWLRIFESIVAFRKEANALGYHRRFFRLDEQKRELLDRAIGHIVHGAIHPHQTMIYVQEKEGTFSTTYISGQDSTSFRPHHSPRGNNSLTDAHDNLRINIFGAPDFDAGNSAVPTGLESYSRHHGFQSGMIVPVYDRQRCYCLIVCLFKRENAVSFIELNIVKNMAELLSDYYRLWYRNQEIESQFQQSGEILKQVRELLLMVDVLHDAAEDITTARGHLGMLNPRIQSEIDTLETSKSILDNLITATKHLKLFFKRRNYRNDIRLLEEDISTDKINMKTLLEELKYKYRGHLHNHKISLEYTCPREPVFQGIEIYIRRAIDNAIKNSIEQLRTRTHVRREIRITVRFGLESPNVRAGGEIRGRLMTVEVVDNGPGVSPDLLSSVRERYVSHRGGMGLGVPIMQGACQGHGGTLELTSIWGKDFKAIMTFREIGTEGEG